MPIDGTHILASIVVLGFSFLSGCASSDNDPLSAPNPTSKPVRIAFPAASRLIEVAVIIVVSGNMIDVSIGGAPSRVVLIGIRELTEIVETDPRRSVNIDVVDAIEMILGDAPIFLERDVTDRDSLGRLERYVWLNDGTMLNSMLVAAGFAQVKISRPNVKYAARLTELEIMARSNGWGYWAQR